MKITRKERIPLRKQLWQVHVTTEAGVQIPVGPAMDSSDGCMPLVEQLNKYVATGKLHGWHDAVVLPVTTANQSHLLERGNEQTV
jgi:hypothetical protein